MVGIKYIHLFHYSLATPKPWLDYYSVCCIIWLSYSHYDKSVCPQDSADSWLKKFAFVRDEAMDGHPRIVINEGQYFTANLFPSLEREIWP